MTAGLAGSPAVAAVVARYRLALQPRRHRGRPGGRRGTGSGSSQEHFGHRDYAPGDDLRHLDWRSFARSERMSVRLFEAEVAPYADLVVDLSASMAVTAAKERAARELLAALAGLAQTERAACRVHALGGGLLAPGAVDFTGTGRAPSASHLPLRAGGVRILLTDGLWQASPAPLVHALAAGAAWFVCVQLLDPWEDAPVVGEVLQLVDCETGERAERLLDRNTVLAYQERLARLTQELHRVVTASGGLFVRTLAGGIETMFARDLLPAGVVEPA